MSWNTPGHSHAAASAWCPRLAPEQSGVAVVTKGGLLPCFGGCQGGDLAMTHPPAFLFNLVILTSLVQAY